MRIARAVENAGAVGSAVGSGVASEVGSVGADDATGVGDGLRVGSGSGRDEASLVQPVTRSAAAAMPTYPRMSRP